MKKNILLLTAALGLAAATTGRANLILTGIVDGPLSGGTPKAVELFVVNDISDLSLYGVELVSNAGSTAGTVETFFSGSATAGDYLYVSSEATAFQNVFGFSPTFTTGDANHNGDDDFYIYGPDGASTAGAVLLDVWGGSDGLDNTGTAYDVLDSWAYRADGTGPSTTFNTADWTIAAPDSLDGLTASEVNSTVPFGTYAIPEPSTFALLALTGLAAFGVMRRKNK